MTRPSHAAPSGSIPGTGLSCIHHPSAVAPSRPAKETAQPGVVPRAGSCSATWATGRDPRGSSRRSSRSKPSRGAWGGRHRDSARRREDDVRCLLVPSRAGRKAEWEGCVASRVDGTGATRARGSLQESGVSDWAQPITTESNRARAHQQLTQVVCHPRDDNAKDAPGNDVGSVMAVV